MKRLGHIFTAICVLSALLFACERENGHDYPMPDPSDNTDTTAVTPTPDPEPEQEPQDSTLVPPSDLEYTIADGVITLTWKDRCAVEEGYLVIRTRSGKSDKHFLKRNATTYSESLTDPGSYLYEVFTYSGLERSEPASFTYTNLADAKVGFSYLESSWNMAAVVISLESDGGEACTVGVEYDGRSLTYTKTLTSGQTAMMVVRDLDYGKMYSIKAWASNSTGKYYSAPSDVMLKEAPKPYSISWTELSGDYGLPSGLKVYKASTSVTGSNVNMWYAIADPATIELRTTLASSLQTPSTYAASTSQTELVIANGGYFGAPNTSYSHVTDHGSRVAKNIGALTRTENYSVTRGAFGVDQSGKHSVYWIYDDASSTRAYSVPLPVIDGAPALTPTSSYPVAPVTWKPYNAIGGAPVLLKDGRIMFDFLKTPAGKYFSNHELLQSDIFADGLKAPRTAVGATSDGHLVIFVCDGRNSGGSAGLTLDEEARVLMAIGCVDALNLDGGGSSAICVGTSATLLNKPSDGSQRKVLSFVSFVAK